MKYVLMVPMIIKYHWFIPDISTYVTGMIINV